MNQNQNSQLNDPESSSDNRAEFSSLNPKENNIESTNFEIISTEQDILVSQSSSRYWKTRIWRIATLLSISGVILLLSQPGRGLLLQMSRLLDQNSSTSQTTSLSHQALSVETLPIQTVRSYSVQRTYTGMLKAKRQSDLGFERSGTLLRVTVDKGQWVATGTPLASLDIDGLKFQQSELLAQRTQAVAQLEEMQEGPRDETILTAEAKVRELQSQLQLARAKQTRRKSLYRDGAISQEQLDEVSFTAQTLQAQLDQAQSQLDELRAGTRDQTVQAQQARIAQWDATIAKLDREIRKGTLFAPFSGTISERLADEGTVVASGQPILSLMENGVIEAHIGVPSAVVERLQPGGQHKIQVDSRSYPAVVIAVLPELEASTQTQTVVLAINAVTPSISPGQTARLTLRTARPVEGFWLPTTALVQGEQGVWSCYVLVDSSAEAGKNTSTFQVKRKTIDIIHTEGEKLLVQGHLQSGDRVVISGTHRIVPGQWVRP